MEIIIQDIDKKVLSYVAKWGQKYVVSADSWRIIGGRRYNVEMDINGEEVTIFADSVVGLKWAVTQAKNGRRGVIYG